MSTNALIAGLGGFSGSYYQGPAGQFNGAAPFHASVLFQLMGDPAGTYALWGNQDPGPAFGGWLIYIHEGTLAVSWGDGSIIDTIVVDVAGALDSTWALVTFVWTGSAVELWLNGTRLGSKTTTLVASTQRALLGASISGVAPFEGLIAGATYSTQTPFDIGTYFTEIARTLEIGVAGEGNDCGTPNGLPSNAWQAQFYNDKLVGGLPASSWTPTQGVIPLTRVDQSGDCVFVQSTPPVFAASGAHSNPSGATADFPPPRWVWGLQVNTSGGTTYDVGEGQAVDSTDTTILVYPGGNVDLSINGAGGLDTGTVAADTFYYTFLIGGPSVPTAVIATATYPGTPTLPAGYTLFRYLGPVMTDSLTQLRQVRSLGMQNDRWYCFDRAPSPSQDLGVVPAVDTTYELTALIPPTATRLRAFAEASFAAGDSGVAHFGSLNDNGTHAWGVATQEVGGTASLNQGYFESPVFVEAPFNAAKIQANVSGDANVDTVLYFLQWFESI
jgi:hypothetical protein